MMRRTGPSREPVPPAAGVTAVAGGPAGPDGPGGTASPPAPKPRWGMPDAAVGWLLAQVAAQITFSLAYAASGVDDIDDMSLGWLALGNVGLWAVFLFAPWWVSRIKGNGLVRDFGLRAKLVDVLGGLPTGFILQFVAALALFLFYAPFIWLTDFEWSRITDVSKDITDRADDPFSAVMLILMVGILAPVFEEIFYRGLVLRSVEKRLGVNWGIAISSLAFGLSHMNLAIPGLVVFGVVVAVVTVRSGRLGPAIAIHIGFNLTTAIGALAS